MRRRTQDTWPPFFFHFHFFRKSPSFFPSYHLFVPVVLDFGLVLFKVLIPLHLYLLQVECRDWLSGKSCATEPGGWIPMGWRWAGKNCLFFFFRHLRQSWWRGLVFASYLWKYIYISTGGFLIHKSLGSIWNIANMDIVYAWPPYHSSVKFLPTDVISLLKNESSM